MKIEDIAKQVLELDEKATKEPWYAVLEAREVVSTWENKSWRSEGYTVSPDKERHGWETDGGCPGYSLSKLNADCIADYRTSAPVLARAVLSLLEQNAKMKKALEYYANGPYGFKDAPKRLSEVSIIGAEARAALHDIDEMTKEKK